MKIPEQLVVKLQEFPHLQITPEELEDMFNRDSLIRDCLVRVEEQEEKNKRFDSEAHECEQTLASLDERRVALEAELRVVDTQIREVKGAIKSWKYHRQLGVQRISMLHARIEARKRMAYKQEVAARLKAIGKELKLDVGRRVTMLKGSSQNLPDSS